MRRRALVRSSLLAMAGPLRVRSGAGTSLFREAPRFPQDLTAVTGDGRRVTVSGKAIADLRAALRGPVHLAGNEGYDQARQIRNPSFNRRPALIAQPSGPADVRTAVSFARDHGGLLLAVKCGGHSASAAEHVAWIRQYWGGIEPFTSGFYVNDLEAGASLAAIQRNYRTNHERLVAVKNRYDPRNLFRLNANVKPTV